MKTKSCRRTFLKQGAVLGGGLVLLGPKAQPSRAAGAETSPAGGVASSTKERNRIMNANEVEKKFGFLVFHGLEELDLVGPWEMISLWGKSLQGPGTRLLVAQTRDPVVCAKGMSINPQVTFNECPQLDYLLVPGGEGTREQVNNEALIRFVAGQAKACQAVLSVCTGSFILHRAGLLSGRRATTHWSALSRLTELGDVKVCQERVVRDGQIWTAAGISAGIDLALEFIESVAGEAVAGKVQFGAEYYPSGRLFGTLHESPQAPAYLKRKPDQQTK
jgi:transcriptional regulator GlxA family with amidase domain